MEKGEDSGCVLRNWGDVKGNVAEREIKPPPRYRHARDPIKTHHVYRDYKITCSLDPYSMTGEELAKGS